MTTATLEPQTVTPQTEVNAIANSTSLPLANDVRFTDFNISDSLKNRLSTAGFSIPTPVQAKAIPPALEGSDILATASTGTGKTLSFLIPMIERMDANSVPSTKGKRGPIRALILLPTRELAMQVLEAYWKLVPGSKNDAVLVCGGLSENNQLDQLDRGPRLVVATPGRLEDFLRRREININAVEMLVLDEVDRMLDMGFLPAIRRIVGAVPKTRQTMCYSATLDANIREIVRDYVNKPVRIEIGQTSKPSDRVELRVYTVMQDQKLGLLDQMLREEEGTFLVFSRTKHGADRISKKLERLGHDADVIHGDRSQSQRSAALKGFQNGKHRVLVATDVAARGIDVNDIAHVINYDLPNAAEDFVHRIGRTGRAGKKGVATTFVMPQEKHDARKLERELKIKFEWREADKNLEKELRNQPLDTTAQGQNLMQLETRTWRGNDPVAPMAAPSNPYKAAKGSGSGFRSRGKSGGGGFSGGRSSGGRGPGSGSRPNSRPGSSRSGPARRGQ
ncbi:MAG TPA: DEAD/DEAH box helicase [Edaphobacter sp.]|uniref:DEAD/DEAH box helicase n=1 Tax=Edaphobacter sp. TaxID=1934404 RepID=UPI002BF02008|nr:DEAD/DEAH box helicase [Edaphobacter sp.]HUZ95906.1 DEAD/DEAH box helicase [Edaphobacter sp.]